MTRKRKRNSRALIAAVAALASYSLPASAAIIGTCTIMISASGTMKSNPAINIFGSRQVGGSSAG
ncbi:MAG: hypothetical protein E5X98_30950, partial [Mesorhizobium sp.]